MSKTIKVLMVDDEERFRAATKNILDRWGFETIVAANGEEAIRKLQEEPDVVILDVKMPGMDGHQVLAEMKRLSPKLPVIMLTGHGALPSAKEALAQGAFDYLAKPCDITLLTHRIHEAYQHGRKQAPAEEKTVADIMIPIEDYTTVHMDATVEEAIEKLRESFSSKLSTSRIMETGHRSIVVFDRKGEVKGILAIIDLIAGLMPNYLFAPKPSTADRIQYSPMFWSGMFTRETKKLAAKPITEVMSPAPLTVKADANLMEAAYTMFTEKVRRLAVTKEGKVVGIVREQELFFEMERILRS